jgi:hypothetical protein
VWTSIHSPDERRIGSEVLLDRTSEGVLDSGTTLDDASDRDGPSIGRLPESRSDERTRCGRGVSIGEDGHHLSAARALPLQARESKMRRLHPLIGRNAKHPFDGPPNHEFGLLLIQPLHAFGRFRHLAPRLGQQDVSSRLSDPGTFSQDGDAVEPITPDVFPSGFFDEIVVYEALVFHRDLPYQRPMRLEV